MEDRPRIPNRLVYDPLAEDTFRVLNLRSATQERLVADLKTVSLKDAPRYHTLSYCWKVGAVGPDVELAVGDHALLITATLADALHRLRDQAGIEFEQEGDSSVEESRWDPIDGWIWIDQICINQEDMDEREAQVSLMGAIYSGAIRTIVWLGPAEDQSELAWPLIHQMYDIFRKENPHAKYLADIPFRLYSDETHAERGLPPFEAEIWTHFRELFAAPWFRRIWVTQEAALSRRNPAVLHGPHVHSWERLGLVASWLRKNGYHRLAQMPMALANVDTISNVRQSKRWKLNALIWTTSIKFHASNGRDKVYGLLGLSEEYQDRSKIPPMLMPDYTLDVATVYTMATRHILGERENLSVFTRVGIFKDRDLRKSRGPIGRNVKDGGVLPSWVPNWDDITEEWEESIIRSGLSWAQYSNAGEAAKLGFPEKYTAAGGLPPDLPGHEESQELSILRIGGLLADTIEGVAPWDDSDVGEPALLKCWKLASRLGEFSNVTDLVTAFIKATTAEQYNLGGRQEEQMHRDGAAYLRTLLSTQEEGVVAQDSLFNSLDVIETLTQLGDEGKPEPYERLARNYSSARTFYVTSHRKSLGIGPMPTQENDIVAVLFGGGTPYILRPAGARYAMIGESYTLGLMEAQAVKEWQAGHLERKLFELE